MKKLLSIALALVLILSMSTAAFAQAEPAPSYSDQSTVTVTKVYQATNDGTSSPTETFTLQQVGDGTVKDGEATTAPALGTITGASFAAGAATTTGAEADIIITLPTYTVVGVYEYTLQEVAGTTAGVTYYGNTIKLVVSVINDNGIIRVAAVHTEGEGEEKTDKFTNTYSAGALSITKTVTGNMGDKDKYFQFTVTLTGENGKTYPETFAVTGGSNTSTPTSIKLGEATTFYLKDGETITIANLPYGVSYTVVEADYKDDDYTTTYTGDNGVINAATQTAAFTNNKSAEVDTGVVLDSLPYVLILAVVAGGLVLMLGKKRAARD